LLQLPERHDGAIFSPRRAAASLAVTLFAEKEETGIDNSLTREWVRGEAFDGWLGDPIHEPKVFVPSFLPWTNLSFQTVNEGSVLAENIGDLVLLRINL